MDSPHIGRVAQVKGRIIGEGMAVFALAVEVGHAKTVLFFDHRVFVEGTQNLVYPRAPED
jgi:hypothetical protein